LPVYEYRCSRGHEYEKVEGFQAPTEHACPDCGQTARRRISAPAVIFKGSGFYSTDNRKSSGSNGSSGNGASEDHGHSPDASETKSEAKAEAKSEAKAD